MTDNIKWYTDNEGRITGIEHDDISYHITYSDDGKTGSHIDDNGNVTCWCVNQPNLVNK